MKLHDHFDTALTPEEITFVRYYVSTGFNGERAVRFTWPSSVAASRRKAERLLADPRIVGVLGELQRAAIDSLKVETTPILAAAHQRELDAPIIEAITGALVNRINTKTAIVNYTTSSYGVTHREVKQVLERYTGGLWTLDAKTYTLVSGL